VAYLCSICEEMLKKIMKIATSGSLSMNQDAMPDYTHKKQDIDRSTTMYSPMCTYDRVQ